MFPHEQPESAGPEVRAFISYTHDSTEHREAVLSIAYHLRELGVNAWLDQFDEVPPPKSWPAWMYDQIDRANFVLAICTPSYRRRVEGQETPGLGRGATWEGAILTQVLYEQMERPSAWAIPVLIEGFGEESIPYFLRGTTHYRIEPESAASYSRLLDHLLDRPRAKPNPVGRPPVDLANLRVQPKQSKGPPATPTVGSQTRDHLPEVSLLELLGEASLVPRELARRWTKGRSASPPLLIGKGLEGVVLWDPVTEGPHALVAGTTGSGKSELLRTILASIALTYSPDVWTFLLIDYKGGNAFGQLVGLPHTIGLVTELDPNVATRLTDLLESELRRRERLLTSWGLKSISDLWEESETGRILPRLLIVVDEFASLAQEQPEFMEGLVNVAKTGRSLGVHFILATQRPSGVITSDIRANTATRFALRVADAADSQDVINAPDASTLSHRDPGLGYMRTFGSEPTLFRTALSRSLSGQPPWDLDDVVAAAAQAAELSGLRRPGEEPWVRGLPEALPFDFINRQSLASEMALGLLDDRVQLTLRPLRLHDGRLGNLRVVGTTVSGKTTALLTIVRAYSESASPGELEVFVVQGRRRQLQLVADFPHTVLTVRNEAHAQALDLFRLLISELDRRLAMRELHHTVLPSTDSWLGRPGPRMLLVVDDAHFLVDEAPEAAVLLQRLWSAPENVGIDLVLTTDYPAAVGSLSAVEGRTLALRLSHENDYIRLGAPAHIRPAGLPPGRGYLLPDGYWVQFAFVRPTRSPNSVYPEAGGRA
jgi:DNA segregation ATPase FtsK/SpoIIIE, S-DNA-T family